MAASNDMLCLSYKSVWIDPIEAVKKSFFDVVILRIMFCHPTIETILSLGFYFHLGAF